MTVGKVAAIVVGGVAVLDLTTGSSASPILPATIGNVLTQPIDFALLVLAVILWLFF